MKGILKEASNFINETYEGRRDANKAHEIIKKLNEMYKNESIEITKKNKR